MMRPCFIYVSYKSQNIHIMQYAESKRKRIHLVKTKEDKKKTPKCKMKRLFIVAVVLPTYNVL